MGQNLHLMTEFPDHADNFLHSDYFNGLMLNTINKNSVLEQMGLLLNLDLSLFYKVFDIEDLFIPNEYESYKLLKNKDTIISHKRAEELRLHFLENTPIHHTWTKIENMYNLLVGFKETLTKKPNFYLYIKTNLDWNGYFMFDVNDYEEKILSQYHTPSNILEDISNMEYYLNYSMEMNRKFVTLFRM